MTLRATVLVLPLALAACSGSAPARRAEPAQPAADAVPAPAPVPGPRSDVLVARARALRAEGDLAGARARLESALAAGPASDDVRVELADLLVTDASELPRASELLAGVQVRDGRFHLLSAQLAELRGDDAGAAAAYADALAAVDDPDVRLRRALALERLGQGEDATAELERLREARPDDALVRARLAERYEADGKAALAEKELRAVAEAAPERAASWDRLARFYERQGRAADARAAAERARDAGGRKSRDLRPLLPSKR